MPDLPTTQRTTCTLDCPDLCQLQVTLTDGRVEALDGDPSHRITAGFICRKVHRYAEHVYGEARLRHPARRVGPKGSAQFEPISWEEAFQTITQRFRQLGEQHGYDTILPLSYGGSNGKLTDQAIDARFFRRLGARRLDRTVCAAATGRALSGLYGKMPGVGFADYESARLVVLWGVNPNASGIHLVPWIRKAQRQGAKLIVVDPRRTPLATQSDLHLALRPGTDLVVALSLINRLFETEQHDLKFLQGHTRSWEMLAERARPWSFERAAEIAGIAPQQLEQFFEWYQQSSPAVIRCGWGLERNRNGGSAVAAVLALPAVAGKFGVRGGGFTLSNSGAWKWRTEAAINAEEPNTPCVNMNQVGQELCREDPTLRAVFVYNCNPLATLPNQTLVRQGLAREDLFTVVFDQVLTDTARYADILLPATTFLEHQDCRSGYGTGYLQRVEPVIEPVGEARANYDVFDELCQRMDLSSPDDVSQPDDYLRAILPADVDENTLRTAGSVEPPCTTHPVQFVDVFPGHPDQKVDLFPVELDRESPQGLYAYQPDPAPEQLALISPAASHLISSTFGQLATDAVPVEVHPRDAAALGLSSGDLVRVENEYGVVECETRVTEDVRPGVVALSKGLWSHHTRNGNTSNAVSPDSLTDLGGGACFNDARVRITKIR